VEQLTPEYQNKKRIKDYFLFHLGICKVVFLSYKSVAQLKVFKLPLFKTK